MDKVLPLPTLLKIPISMYSPGAGDASIPSLCRLYFGKALDGLHSRFSNSANRGIASCSTATKGDDYPSSDEIAIGMGQMVGRLHWRSKYDGRDIEFVTLSVMS